MPWLCLVLTGIITKNTYHRLILAVVLTLTIFLGLQLRFLRFDYDFEAFFPNEDSELEFYNDFRNTFEYDNEFVLVAIENRRGIFKSEFLSRFDSLAGKLAMLEDVEEVQTPTRFKRYDTRGLVPVSAPVLHINDDNLLSTDSQLVYNEQILVGSFFPANARSLSMMIKTQAGLSKKRSDSLAARITRQVKDAGFTKVHLAGRIFAQEEYLQQLKKEFVLFIIISLLLVVVFLWLTFRDWAGVLLPLTIVLTAILWTLGIMVLLGKPVDLLTTMLPTMIFVTGMSDVIHYFSKYFDLRNKGAERSIIFKKIIREVGLPTFITLLTTVVAFLSLLFSSIRPVRDFGIYVSIGITIAFILSYTLLPALLHFLDPERVIRQVKHARMTGLMRSVLFFIFRKQRQIILTSCVLILVAISGISRIRVNNLLLEDLDERSPVKRAFLFFDEHYRGVRPFELEVHTNTGTLFDLQKMRAISRVDSFIRSELDPGFLFSPFTFLQEYARAEGSTVEELTSSGEEYAPVQKVLLHALKSKHTRRFITEDGRRGRITGKIRDIGSAKASVLSENILSFANNAGNEAGVQFTLTGAAHLVDRNNEYMVKNMLQGFGFSVLTIGLLTFILHRSWRMVIVFIIPNVVPLIIIAGIMGFAGIELKAATSIIFSIAFGIATDDTIHFISRLRIERSYGKNMLYAFKRTYFETGRPIVLTTFILLGGFLSLMTSDFASTFYFGLLTCITIVIALIADIFLLPVLLFILYRKN